MVNIKTRIVRLLVVLNKKLKFRNSSRNKSSDTDSSGVTSSDGQEFTNFSFSEQEAPLKTSTPLKQNQFKIIMIQEVSHLKIYEDFDEIDQYTNNNFNDKGNKLETLDISEVTVYENLRFLRNDLEFLKRSVQPIPFIDESGYKIYEDVGEFAFE